MGASDMAPSPLLSKRRGDLRRPVAQEAFLVVEVHAHPELASARVHRGLELLDALRGRADRREPVRQVVDEAELLDQPVVRAPWKRVAAEGVPLAEDLHL